MKNSRELAGAIRAAECVKVYFDPDPNSDAKPIFLEVTKKSAHTLVDYMREHGITQIDAELNERTNILTIEPLPYEPSGEEPEGEEEEETD